VAIRPAAGSWAAASLACPPDPALAKTLYKVSFPRTGIWGAYPLSFASDPAVGKDPRPLIGWSWSWRSSLLSAPLLLLSGPFRFWRGSRWRSSVSITRLRPSSVESSAGCWRSRPFGWSRSSRAEATGIPGTPAGILLGLWCAP
jgi:hypothetical protein